MTEATTKLERAIQQAASQYFRLVILAGVPASGKTATLQSVAQMLGCQLVNVNLELSKRLLELTRTQRSRQVERLLKEVIGATPGDLILLDNLEILFDTSLEVEPLRLLQLSSRNRTIVASWNGSFQAGTLTYAEPGHPEFANELTERVVTVAQHVQTGLPCWGSELIPAEDREHERQKLDELKAFLEGLQAFNTPGKLKNFSKSVLEIQGHVPTLDLIKQIEDLNTLVQELTVLTGYLGTAAAVLPPQDPWRAQMETMRSEWRAKLMDPTVRGAADFRQKIHRALQKVKDDYRTAYFNLHKKARLGANEDGKKKELLKDARLESLKKLTGVSLLSHSTLRTRCETIESE